MLRDYTESGDPYLFPAYDGNGNVTGWVNSSDGKFAARYEYGPFGEPIRATSTSGTLHTSNPFRFSTKYTDVESGLLYYGFRYYNPQTGRWLSRDPVNERGGLNLYGFTKNAPVNYYDLLGMSGVSIEKMIEVLHDIERVKNALYDCDKIKRFLDCVKCNVWKGIEKNVDAQIIKDAYEFAGEIKNRMTIDGAGNAGLAIATLDFLEIKFDSPGVRDIVGAAEQWNGFLGSYQKYVIEPIGVVGKVTEGDALGGFLSVGNYLADIAIPPQLSPLKEWLKFYEAAYTTSVSTLNGLKYEIGDGAFAGKLKRALEFSSFFDCSLMREIFIGGFPTFTGCEEKHLK